MSDFFAELCEWGFILCVGVLAGVIVHWLDSQAVTVCLILGAFSLSLVVMVWRDDL